MPKVSLKLPSPIFKILLILPTLTMLGATFYIVKWCFGNAISTQLGNAKTAEEETVERELSKFAMSLAPDDPQTFYAAGVIQERTGNLEQFPEIITLYEKAAARSPNDYRYWLALGKIRERAGDSEGGEKAVRKALELAPNYSNINWTLGNILLRRNNTEEAFAYLRQAASGDETLVSQVVALAWDFFDGDIQTIRANVGDSPTSKVNLAILLARNKRAAEAMQIWGELDAEATTGKFRDSGITLFNYLTNNKDYRAALKTRQSIMPNDAEKPELETLLNPSFENDTYFGKAGTDFFGWQIAEGGQPQVGVNSAAKQDGERSLVFVFSSPTGKEFRDVSQTVAVESNTHYTLEFFGKSGGFRTKETILWQVTDLNDGKIAGSSVAIPSEAGEWQKFTIDFQTSSATEAVRLQIARAPCQTCTLNGKVWFDNFSLRKK